MEPIQEHFDALSFEKSLQDYKTSLEQLFTAEDPTFRMVLNVMRSRDLLQVSLMETVIVDNDALEEIVQLDLRLKQDFQTIDGNHTAFEQAKNSLQPPDSSWWWHLTLKPKPIEKKGLSDRFDWLWNLGTVACLVVSTAFMSQTAKAFSTKGFDVLGVISTITQGAGLVVVAGGALTDRGQKSVSKILNDLRIPESLHAEATFGASLVVLGAAYGLHQNLPVVGNFYFQQGKAYEENSQFAKSLNSYARAQDFAPDDEKILIASGFLHEEIGQFDKAIEQYEKGSRLGFSEFWNAHARAVLFREMQKNNWRSGGREDVLKQAESLLKRTYKRINFPDRVLDFKEWTQNDRLAADINLNLLNLEIMRLRSPEDLENFPNEATEYFSELLKIDVDNLDKDATTPLTIASTLGSSRSKCLLTAYQRNMPVENLEGMTAFQALDKEELDVQYQYECASFIYDPSLSSSPDSLFLDYMESVMSPSSDNSLDSDYLIPKLLIGEVIYNGVPWDSEPVLASLTNAGSDMKSVQSPEKWTTLRNGLNKKLLGLVNQASSDGLTDADRNIVWRVIVNQAGQVMDYFAYDENSRSVDTTSVFGSAADRRKVVQEAIQAIQSGKSVEFADFKVVISPKGAVLNIIPWAIAYPAYYQVSCLDSGDDCSNPIPSQAVQSAFQNYVPNLNQLGEVGALRAMLYATINFLERDAQASFFYQQPIRYELQVSTSGEIMSYKALDPLTSQQLGQKFPRQRTETTQLSKPKQLPTTSFQVEFRGVNSFRITHPSDQPAQ